MATVTKGRTFVSGETVTPAKLNDLVDQATVTAIQTADISDSAVTNAKIASGMDASKLTTGTLPSDRIGSDAITTARINNAAVTAAKLDGAQAGSAPIYGARAWVNFDGTTAANLSGTYSQSGTAVTVTATAHGLRVGHVINVDATSGTGVDGTYTVATVPDANTFTYTAGTSLTTSGNITIRRRSIRASGNVANVSYVATGEYAVNFTTDMPDASYAICGSAGGVATDQVLRTSVEASILSASCARAKVNSDSIGYFDASGVTLVVFR